MKFTATLIAAGLLCSLTTPARADFEYRFDAPRTVNPGEVFQLRLFLKETDDQPLSTAGYAGASSALNLTTTSGSPFEIIDAEQNPNPNFNFGTASVEPGGQRAEVPNATFFTPPVDPADLSPTMTELLIGTFTIRAPDEFSAETMVQGRDRTDATGDIVLGDGSTIDDGIISLSFASGSISTAAIPEPSTMMLLGVAFVGFGGYQLRRRRQARAQQDS